MAPKTVNRTPTLKQILFVKEYLANGGNGLQAAISAGYSKHTAASAGSRLLTQSNVIHELSRAQAALQAETVYDATFVIQGVGAIASAVQSSDANRLRAYELLGKCLGLFVERSVTASMDMDAGSLSATLELVAGLSPAGLPAAPPACKSLQDSSLDDA
tara:strand:+ start:410 stop:886 length:477 start_codon:yes stop_codon:yes gene_type:complete